MSTLVTQGGPKVDKNGFRDPVGAQGASKTQTGPRAQLELPAFLELLGRPWALQGSILDPRGVQKGYQNRHGEARSAPWGGQELPKGSSKGSPEMGSKKLSKWVPTF